jgi:hypothetical protein
MRTKQVRMGVELAELLEQTWPEYSMPERLQNIYDFSLAKFEPNLRLGRKKKVNNNDII